MKSLLTLTLVFLASLFINAQITIDFNNLPDLGHKLYIAFDSLEENNLSAPNLTVPQSWDLTHLWPMNNDSITYIAPGDAPFTQFDTSLADLAVVMSGDFLDGLINEGYVFFKIENDGVYSVALAASLMGQEIILNATNPELIMPVPISIGDTIRDTARYEVILNEVPYTVDPTNADTAIVHYAYKEFVVDAFGTIDLGLGSFPVIRLVETSHIIDSIYILTAIPIFPPQELNNSIETRVSFITNDATHKHPLVTYSIDDSNKVKYVSYIWDGTTPNTGHEQLNREGLKYYPNPVTDFLEINFQNKDNRSLSLVLKDMSGKLIKEIDLHENSFDQYRLNMAGLNKGYYFISINHGKSNIGNWKVFKN